MRSAQKMHSNMCWDLQAMSAMKATGKKHSELCPVVLAM